MRFQDFKLLNGQNLQKMQEKKPQKSQKNNTLIVTSTSITKQTKILGRGNTIMYLPRTVQN